MKWTLLLSLAAVTICGSSCSDKLGKDGAAEIIAQQLHYPQTLIVNVQMADSAYAKKALSTNLARKGYIVAAEPGNSTGKPLLSFTDKSKPLFLETSSADKARLIQNVKAGEAELYMVNRLAYSVTGDSVTAEYTVMYNNMTDFVVLLNKDISGSNIRTAYLRKVGGVWQVSE